MWREIKFLVVDDDDQRRRDMKVILDFLGDVNVTLVSDGWQENALSELGGTDELGAVIVGSTGLPLAGMIQAVADWDEGLPVILISEPAEYESLDENLRHRVIASVAMPPSYNKLLDTLHRAQMYREQYELSRGRGHAREVNLFRSLVGTSRGIQQVREMMTQVADKEVTVMIQGESGTGKEVVARNLHYNSNRRDKPFVPVNCGAIPGELIESELFGHEKGAFTGAISARAGRFELAEGGTLFLDEIGDLPLNMQVKLLRVLQERTFERVGGNKTYNCDIRVIAATHRDLEKMIAENTFREDLYYRLNVFPIEMPPLRERSEDVPVLLNELIARLENENRGSIRFSSAAVMSLIRHDWPGNVREMANLAERLAIMHPQGVVGVQELPLKYRHVDDEDGAALQMPVIPENESLGITRSEQAALLPVNGLDLKEYLTELERDLIQQALEDSQGVVARAAEKLHIRRTTLVEKMRKYNIQKSDTVS